MLYLLPKLEIMQDMLAEMQTSRVEGGRESADDHTALPEPVPNIVTGAVTVHNRDNSAPRLRALSWFARDVLPTRSPRFLSSLCALAEPCRRRTYSTTH